MSTSVDLSKLSYKKLRMPMDDTKARDEEIKRRIKQGHNPPIGRECKVCGFMPCTTTEMATHIIEHKNRGERP